MALILAKAGESVGLVERRQAALEEVRAQITDQGGKAHAVALDVTDLGVRPCRIIPLLPPIITELINNNNYSHC